MRSDQESLLATIAANPADDLPRLVYADWLDENGRSDADRARAEFIRYQVADALAREPAQGSRLDDSLLHAHRDDWLADVPAVGRYWVAFHRGFPAAIHPHTGRTQFLPLLEAPPPSLATVTGLRLGGPGSGLRAGDVVKIAASAGLKRVTRLTIDTLSPGVSHAALLASPNLAGLKSLTLGKPAADPQASLAGATLRGLEELTLHLDDGFDGYRHTQVISRWLAGAAVADYRLLDSVRDLTVAGGRGAHHYTDADAFAALAVGRVSPRLVHLTLALRHGYDTALFDEFVDAFDRPALRTLTVTGFDLTDAHLDRVAGHPGLARLEALELPASDASADAVCRLFASAGLPALCRLTVEVRRGDLPAVCEYLIRTGAADRLEQFSVGWPGDEWAARLRERYGPRFVV